MAGQANSAKPTAAIAGPTTSGIFAPTASTSEPAQRDSANMIATKGSSAAPAAVAP